MIRFSQQKPRSIGDVNLTPMIDIVFNLLIFFLIVAVISQKGLNLTLPKTSTAEQRPPHSLEIVVTADSRVLFDGEEVAPAGIEARLRALREMAEGERADNILLKADEQAPFGLFVTVMDMARKVGLTNLVIATEMRPDASGDGD